MIPLPKQRILILDFGSQYSQLIARKVRECGVYCELHPYTLSATAISDFSPNGIILSGGPESVTLTNAPRVDEIIFSLGCPILGICYGMQTMAQQLGGIVESSTYREFGLASVQFTKANELWGDLFSFKNIDVWMSHGDRVTQLPAGFQTIAANDHAPIAAMADVTRRFYGVQFHPEVTHTIHGREILSHFLFTICQCEASWTAENMISKLTNTIREQVGSEKIILGLSGGVDSSVLAMLLQQAVHDQFIGIFIDNGLLRANEAAEILNTFTEYLQIPIHYIDASERFLQALNGIHDPEQKRKIIGKVFIDVFQEEAARIPDVKWLAQGTIYPDVIESAREKAGFAHVIKSHHNVGGLPDTLRLKLLEPFRHLFKDEVRQIGLTLGLPEFMIHRHPFPGPGLGVRILGEIKEDYLQILRQADAIFMEELKKADLYNQLAQAFCVFLPLKSVAVMGDARYYEYIIALRAVETTDFMTANWAKLPHDFLEKVATRIYNEVAHVSRVVFDISNKPPATIEWE